MWVPFGTVDHVVARAARAWARRYDSVPVSMMFPANVKRSTIAAVISTSVCESHS
jgi:hypothetical protein